MSTRPIPARLDLYMRRRKFLFNQPQLKFIISLLSGVGQIFVGTVILGYFFPGIAGPISFPTFIAGLFSAIICFIAGLFLSGKVKEDD